MSVSNLHLEDERDKKEANKNRLKIKTNITEIIKRLKKRVVRMCAI